MVESFSDKGCGKPEAGVGDGEFCFEGKERSWYFWRTSYGLGTLLSAPHGSTLINRYNNLRRYVGYIHFPYGSLRLRVVD